MAKEKDIEVEGTEESIEKEIVLPAEGEDLPEVKVNIKDTGIKVNKQKTYTGDEVIELISEATRKGAKISKDQLYSGLTSAKTRIKELEAEVQRQVKIVEEASNKKPADKTDKSDEEIKKENEKLTLLESDLTETKKKLTLMEDSFAKASEDAKKSKLEAYAAKLIADAKGKVIDKMVKGDSIEEINQSFTEAKAEYERVQGDLKKNLNLPEDAFTEKHEEAPVDVPSISPNFKQAKADLSNWDKIREKTVKDAYRQAGFKV